MNFGGWLPLNDAPAVAPEMPGVLQARADALIPYPKGKSAMVLYARSRADQPLRHYVAGAGAAGLGRAAAAGARWIRFADSPDPDREFERLMRRFLERFGATPTANDDDQGARTTDG